MFSRSRPIGFSAIIVSLVLVMASPLAAGIVPPRDGGKLPVWYRQLLARQKGDQAAQHAWTGKVERARAAREAYIHERGFYRRDMLSSAQLGTMSISGNLNVPVFCAKFSNTGADPWPVSSLQSKLYDGPGSPQTLTDFYAEMSYGDVTLSGDVYGWTTLANPDTYYEGPAYCNGLCETGKLDEFINEVLTAQDGSIDFGMYDNDGPDNIPNSGDDDRYVDFIAFVHPEVGAECGGTPINIWSHKWSLTSLMGNAWVTNDTSASGGFIRIDDYVMQPAFNCDGTSIIDIGVFAHEYGHAFGLPDLYDTDGGSDGIGHWGLMGSGAWNTTDYPAHFSLWSKLELGWANVVEVATDEAAYTVDAAEFNRTGYRLNVMHERWRRSSDCTINGAYSMRCGLTAAEGNARNWGTGDGYGDEWFERVERKFTYDGNGPVTVSFLCAFDSESGYDGTSLYLEANGNRYWVAAFSGTNAREVQRDLTTPLDDSGASEYTLAFEFRSDFAWSDRDGLNNTVCGAFVFDDFSLTGGGENYFTDFETREDGWVCNMTSPAEYFLVENRQPVGSDIALHGGGGMLIWHVNQDVANTGPGGNSGGTSGTLEKGVYLEQADGLDELMLGALIDAEQGDGGDPFPGVTNNFNLTNATNPSSLSDDGLATHVSVTGISPNPANGGSMSANMFAGWPPFGYTSLDPAVGGNTVVVPITINGSGLASGATVSLYKSGAPLTPQSVYWAGKDRIVATFDLNGADPGVYDVTITNAGGHQMVLPGAFTIVNTTPTALEAISARETSDGVQVSWRTADQVDILGWRLYRSIDGAAHEPLFQAYLDPSVRDYVDRRAAPGHAIEYRLTWLTTDGEELAGQTSVRTASLDAALGQNYPNPFNPVTSIPYVVAERSAVSLRIYNISGQLVRTLVDETREPNRYVARWDGTDNHGLRVASGVYFYRLDTGGFQDVRKLVLTK